MAKAAAHALLNTGLEETKVRLTGPELLSHDDLASIIGRVIGRPVRLQEVSPEGLPAGNGPARGAGPAESVSGEVEAVLCRPARIYAHWVTDHADAFIG